MIIALTGTMASGKGEVANYLKEKGFEYYSYSDIIKEEAKKRNIEPTRENLQKLGEALKKEASNEGILSAIILKKIRTDKAVVDGVRNSEEIRELRKAGNTYIIGIDAPQKLRFERIKERARAGDPKNFEEFKKLDDKENKSIGSAQEINKCIKMADFLIINDKTINALKKEVDKILASL